jgi:hypothetical protein
LIKVFHHEGSTLPPNGQYENVNKVDLAKQTWIGDVRFTLSKLMCAGSQKLVSQFSNSQK